MAAEPVSTLRYPTLVPMIIAVAIGGAFYLAGKQMEKRPVMAEPGTITVSGEGKASVAPDIAEASFGLDTGVQRTTAAAMTKLNDTMAKIYDALQKAGVEKKDIATENFYLNPTYNWNSGTQVLTGYQAMQSLRVKVRDLDKVSAVVSAATDAGANQAGNVTFTVDNAEETRSEARKKAIAQARAKAEQLARDLGVRLGEIKAFSEGFGGVPPIMYARDQAVGIGGGSDAANPTIPAGTQDLSVTVSITYELD